MFYIKQSELIKLKSELMDQEVNTMENEPTNTKGRINILSNKSNTINKEINPIRNEVIEKGANTLNDEYTNTKVYSMEKDSYVLNREYNERRNKFEWPKYPDYNCCPHKI